VKQRAIVELDAMMVSTAPPDDGGWFSDSGNLSIGGFRLIGTIELVEFARPRP
jgi:hypothetical protein